MHHGPATTADGERCAVTPMDPTDAGRSTQGSMQRCSCCRRRSDEPIQSSDQSPPQKNNQILIANGSLAARLLSILVAAMKLSRRVEGPTTSTSTRTASRVVSAPALGRTVVSAPHRVVQSPQSARVVQRGLAKTAIPERTRSAAPRARLVARNDGATNGASTASPGAGTGTAASAVVTVSRGSVRLVSSGGAGGTKERRVEVEKKKAPPEIKKVGIYQG
eukprot:s697_g25.t1